MLDVLLARVSGWWEDGRPRGRLAGLAVMGVVAVWFSFPLVFVMAGVGGTVLLACWREQTRPALPGFAAVVGAWLLAFGCQYVLFARPLAAFLQRKAGGQDVVLVFNDNSSFAVYGRLLGLKQTVVPFREEDFAATRLRIAQELADGDGCWLVISHVTDAERAAVFAELRAVCRLRFVNRQVGADLLAVEPPAAGAGATPAVF